MTQKTNPLGTGKIGSLLFQFALPSIVAMLVSSLYNIVDQIFIGQGMGYLGNGATTVAFPFTTIGLALALLFGVGAASCYSLYLGQGKVEDAARTAGTGLTIMSVVGVIYMIVGELLINQLLHAFGANPEKYAYSLEYSRVILIGMPFLIASNGISQLCRADGSPKYSMMCMIVGAIINCILDPLFIFGFGWGMFGASFATILGQIVTFIVALFYLPRFKQIHLSRNDFKIHGKYLGRICQLGASASLNQAAILVVQIVLNNLLKHYGGLSVYGANIPIAASGVAFKLNGIYISVAVGLAQGAQPIIGFNYGAQQFERVKKCLLLAMSAILILGTSVELVFQFFPVQLIELFGHGDELYLQFGSKVLRIYMAMICIQGIQALSSNFFAAIGQPAKGIFLSLSRSILFYLPLAFVFPIFWGVEGILYSQPIADFASVVVSIIMVIGAFRQMDRMVKDPVLSQEIEKEAVTD